MTSSQPTHFNLALVLGAFIASLFFNGIDIRFFALVFILLLGWLLANGINNYRKGYEIGNFLIPAAIVLFWLWLGINIAFSQVTHLSMINFWWVGIFPLAFLTYGITPDKNAFWKPLLALLVLIVVILCCYALYQTFVLHELPRGTFFNKNSLAALINLLFFPVLAFTLIKSKSSWAIAATASIFIFALLLALVNSRGALLAFTAGTIVMLVLGWSQIEKPRLVMIGMVIIGAFVMASLLSSYSPHITEAGITERIATLQDTENAGHSRFVIWQPAWELFKQHPWTGVGLGCYFLAIPPLLHNDDHSAGFYVHNDFLQIALETGIPGFILLLLILLATLYRLVKALRTSQDNQPNRLHFIALFAALLTLAIHSAFTFNLYIMPIMLLAGFLLGRFNQLADQLEDKQMRYWRPVAMLHPGIYFTVLGLGVAALSSYFISHGVAHHYQQAGYQFAAINQLEKAHRAFSVAQTLAPRLDSVYYADADLLRKSALILADRPQLAESLLDNAMALLARADQLNPLRPQTAYIRGMVLQQASPHAQNEIIEAYQTALQRNPRFIPARIAMARYLLEHDNQNYAFQILQDGLGYSYRQLSPAYFQLLELNLVAANKMGNKELANDLSELLKQYRQHYEAMQSKKRRNIIINPY